MNRVLPILFNTDMVQAILENRKTATRRAVRYKYSNTKMKIRKDKYGTWLIEIQKDVEGETRGKYPDGRTWHKLLPYIEKEPPCKRGDILYVRETWQCWKAHRYEATADIRFRAGGDGVQIQFANGNTDSICRDDYDEFVGKWYSHHGEWHPSIHMPKEAARIWLKVTDVRAERLNEMTLDDFLKEGVVVRPEAFNDPENAYQQAREIFIDIWDTTIKKSDRDRYGWNADPWVWTIEFKPCGKPEPCA